MQQPDRMLAFRLLMRRGEWDVDGFFQSIPASKWEELKVAHALIESEDTWIESVKMGNKKPWKRPDFEPNKKVRRRIDGATY